MTTKVFIDGASGAVGLQIEERLRSHNVFTIHTLPEQQRRDEPARRDALNNADIAILCLPDHSAREAMTLITNPAVRVLDASSAHRVSDGWVYGLPELSRDNPSRISAARFVANPGCVATGAIMLLQPLVKLGLVPVDYPITISAVTGYTAGGRRMIAAFEGKTNAPNLAVVTAPDHRHQAEIRHFAGLAHDPHIMLSIAPYPCGMVVQIPLTFRSLANDLTARQLHEALTAYYVDQNEVTVHPFGCLSSLRAMDFDAAGMKGRDDIELYVAVSNNADQARLIARFDNLGKGAAGAALRNLRLMAGMASP